VKVDKLYLVGFMGAGKTTVGRVLSRRLGWRFDDVDERIEARARKSVAAIFAQHGEPHFRQMERQALSELLPQRNVVVATGGGTFAEADNRALMLADGAVAWLDIPLARVLDRVPADGRRPLASDRPAMEQLYTRRRLTYAEAHVRVDAALPVPEVVERLLEWLEF
jgi:shikimate kinase